MADVRLILDPFLEVVVTGTYRYQGTRTPYCSGSGVGNIEDYTVTIAGHRMTGTWSGDARHNITVELQAGHPLIEPAKLVARMQKARRDLTSMGGKTPIGWHPTEWQAERDSASRDYAIAKAAVMADSIAVILAGIDD